MLLTIHTLAMLTTEYNPICAVSHLHFRDWFVPCKVRVANGIRRYISPNDHHFHDIGRSAQTSLRVLHAVPRPSSQPPPGTVAMAISQSAIPLFHSARSRETIDRWISRCALSRSNWSDAEAVCCEWRCSHVPMLSYCSLAAPDVIAMSRCAQKAWDWRAVRPIGEAHACALQSCADGARKLPQVRQRVCRCGDLEKKAGSLIAVFSEANEAGEALKVS